MYKAVQGSGDEWAAREFLEIERSFRLQDFVRLTETHVEPEKVRDGMIFFADGTDWDPGSGQGIYTYYAGAWHKLG